MKSKFKAGEEVWFFDNQDMLKKSIVLKVEAKIDYKLEAKFNFSGPSRETLNLSELKKHFRDGVVDFKYTLAHPDNYFDEFNADAFERSEDSLYSCKEEVKRFLFESHKAKMRQCMEA